MSEASRGSKFVFKTRGRGQVLLPTILWLLLLCQTTLAFFQFQPSVPAEGERGKGKEEEPGSEGGYSFPQDPPKSEEGRDARHQDEEYCYNLFTEQRALIEPSVKKMFQLPNEELCRAKCNETLGLFVCTFYSFGFMGGESSKDGRCYLTNDVKKSELKTVVSQRFNIYQKSTYCPQLRMNHEQPRSDRKSGLEEPPSRYGGAVIGERRYHTEDLRPHALAQSSFDPACFQLRVSSRRLADRYIKKSETAYSLRHCKELCAQETDFTCNGFAYRRPLSKGEILNCDLTEQTTKSLDQYNNYDFYESAVTDFYELDATNFYSGCDPKSSSLESDNPEPSTEAVEISSSNSSDTQTTEEDCHSRIRVAYKHYTYRDYKTVSTISQCSEECLRTPFCETFSFRFGGLRSNSDTGNCLLSDKKEFELTDGDLVSTSTPNRNADGDWDIYEMRSGGSCNREGPTNFRDDDDICYELFKQDYRHNSLATLKKDKSTSLHECASFCSQQSCGTFSFFTDDESFLHERAFTSSANCLLSNIKQTDLLTSQDLEFQTGWNVYHTFPKSNQSCRQDIETNSNDCHRRERVGYKHYFTSIRDSLAVRSLQQCSDECQQKSFCKTFSYRYSSFANADQNRFPSRSDKNCLLSSLSVSRALSSDSVERDSDWDFYESLRNSFCNRGGGEEPNNGGRYECEVLYQPGHKYHSSLAQEILSAGSLRECSMQCQRLSDIFCRSFSFRASYNMENCILSDVRVGEIKVSQDLLRDGDWNVYENVDRGPQCRSADSSTEECFRREMTNHRFYSTVARQNLNVASLSSCSAECQQARSFSCKSFSFRPNYFGSQDNCQLSSMEVRDLRTNGDLVGDAEWDVYDQLDDRYCRNDNIDDTGNESGCFRYDRDGYKFRFEASSVQARSLQDCVTRCLRMQSCRTFAFKIDYTSRDYENCQLSSLSAISIFPQKDLRADSEWTIYEALRHGPRCEGDGTDGTSEGNCYSRFKAGYRHETTSYRESTRVEDKEECAAQCGRANFCRSFSYQYFATGSSSRNCLLSQEQVRDLNFIDLRAESNWDIYDYFQGCSSLEGGSNGIGGGGAFDGGDGCIQLVEKGSYMREFLVLSTRDAFTVSECESYCRRTSCLTFSYRSSNSYSDRNNCLLSDTRVSPGSRELMYNQDWDTFGLLMGERCERDVDNGSGNEGSDDTGGECYRVFDKFYRLADRIIRDTITTSTLTDCENACTNSMLFDCRSFAYKEGRPGVRKNRNCDLSTLDPRDANFANNVIRDHDYNIYERRSSAACDSNNSQGSGPGDNQGPGDIESSPIMCSVEYNRQRRFEYQIVRDVKNARDLRECEEMCLNSRGFSCTGFSFRYRNQGSQNCELTDQQFSTLDPRYDIDEAPDWDMFERTRFHGECRGSSKDFEDSSVIFDRLSCYNRYREDFSLQNRAIIERLSVRDEEECAEECDRFRERGNRFYDCQAFSFRRLRSGASLNCFLSDSYGRSLDGDIVQDFNSQVWEFRGGGNCKRRSGSAYSVNGKRCRYNAQLNSEVRYWFCETEEDANWDYCCRPDHECGYSEGYEYPWCYVGEAGYDQWRPCSEERMAQYTKSGISQPLIHAEAPPGYELEAPAYIPLNVSNSLTKYEILKTSESHHDPIHEDVEVFAPSSDGKQADMKPLRAPKSSREEGN